MSEKELMLPSDEVLAQLGDRLMEAVDEYEEAQARRTSTHMVAPRRRTRRRLAVSMTGAAAAVAVVVGLVIVNPWAPPPPAIAAPMPLEYQAVDQTPQAVIGDAQQRLLVSNVVDDLRWEAVYLGWERPTTEEMSAADTFAPTYTHRVWAEDHLLERETPSDEGEDTIRRESYEELTLSGFSLGSVDSARVDTVALLDAQDPAWREGGAASAVAAIESVFVLWTLSDEQHSALLDLLVHDLDFRVAGITDDRLGRSVIGLSAQSESNDAVEYTILLSEETGRITGVEVTERQGTRDGSAEAVVSYRHWDVEMP